MVVPTADTYADQLRTLFVNHRVFWRDEYDLQNELARVMTGHRIGHEREVQLGPAGRIDFVIGRLGIEVKVNAPAAAVVRQLTRYAGTGMFDALLLVTTQAKHINLPHKLGDVPLAVLALQGGAW